MARPDPAAPASAAQMSAALAAVEVGLITTDRHRRITSWSTGAERIFGFTADEAIGSTADELPTVTPELADATRRALDSAPRSWLERELPLLRKDGSSFPGRLRVAMTHDSDRVTGSVVLVTDTSLPRASTVELSSPSDHRSIAALGRLAISGLDRGDLLDHALTTVTECLEIELAAVIAVDPDDSALHVESGSGWDPPLEGTLVSADDPQAALLIAGTLPLTTIDIEELDLPADGLLRRRGVRSLAAVGLRGSPQRAGALVVCSRRVRRFGHSEIDLLQAVANVLTAAADRSYAEELEERLERFSRMDALGQLTGGIAHDFNNLLAVILSYASFAREEAEGVGVSAPNDSLRTIEAAAQRAAELTRQLLVFSRQERVELHPTSVAATIRAAADTLRKILGVDVELSFSAPEEQLTVEAGPDQLEQVLFNLAFNASDAMPQGGSFAITVEPDRDAEGEGDWIRLTVADSGRGMSQEVVEKAFDPFFTTKEVGEGPGLGLSTVYGLIASMGGSVGLRSEPGRGTTVDILLPAYAGDQGAVDSAPEASEGTRRVLLVEDDEMVRRLATRVLGDAGFDVEGAADRAEAVELAGSGARFDVILTDLVMAPDSGVEIISAIAPAQPDAAVVFMSGYSSDLMPRELVPDREAGFVAKPFTPETLLAGIERALAAATGDRS